MSAADKIQAIADGAGFNGHVVLSASECVLLRNVAALARACETFCEEFVDDADNVLRADLCRALAKLQEEGEK